MADDPKTGPKTGHFQPGDDPRRGCGKKGRSGRKPLAFAEKCSKLADSQVLRACQKKLKEQNPDDPAWRWAAEYVTKYSKSLAPQRTEVEDVTKLTREEREERLNELLERARGRRNLRLA